VKKGKARARTPVEDSDASAAERSLRLLKKKKKKKTVINQKAKKAKAPPSTDAESSAPSAPPSPPPDDGGEEEGDEGDETSDNDAEAAERAITFVTAHRLANKFDYADGAKVMQFVPGKQLVLCLATGLGMTARSKAVSSHHCSQTPSRS
jgi:hypothetical protein